MSKLPAFQFYPGDWRKDVGVQSLSYHDRGVWFEMLCLMHESERRGLLILNGKPMGDDVLCRTLGLDKQNLTLTLTTLLELGVASRDLETGALMCRRMVRDENLRKVRAEAGKLGGNPALVKQNGTTVVKQIPTPSAGKMKNEAEPVIAVEDLPVDESMFAGRILVECRIGGRDLRMVLEEVARAELSHGGDLDVLAQQAVGAWESYNRVKGELDYAWGAAKFFGEGHWREPPESWPRKQKAKEEKTKQVWRSTLEEE